MNKDLPKAAEIDFPGFTFADHTIHDKGKRFIPAYWVAPWDEKVKTYYYCIEDHALSQEIESFSVLKKEKK